MIRSLVILAVSFAFISCNNKAEKSPRTGDTITSIDNFYWQSGLNDSTGKMEMTKISTADSISSEAILAYLNREHPNIKLQFLRISNDTVYLRIADATYLTQQMGSSGPPVYLSKLVYNFTELPGIKEVNLDFEEGDHASPGTFNRESFKE